MTHSLLFLRLLLLIPLFATSNPTSYSDINGRTRLAARHYGVPGAKTSRKMLEFMPAFAHLPPRPFSRFLWTLAIPHPAAAHSPSLHPSLFPLSVWPFYVKLNPTATATGAAALCEFGNYLPPPHCSTSLPPPVSLSSPPPLTSYLLLSAIEHRVPLRDPRYLVK